MPAIDEDHFDIEDIVGEGDLTGLERSFARSNTVVKRIKKVKVVKNTHSQGPVKPEAKEVDVDQTSEVPGTQKIWVKTWGCAHNNSDSEYMAGQLAAYGYTITGEPSILFFNILNQ